MSFITIFDQEEFLHLHYPHALLPLVLKILPVQNLSHLKSISFHFEFVNLSANPGSIHSLVITIAIFVIFKNRSGTIGVRISNENKITLSLLC